MTESSRESCEGSHCGCGPSLLRREFLRAASLAAAGMASGGDLPAFAGPFEDENEYLRTIPRDKRLDPAWVRSLYERGEKQTCADRAAQSHIGMPVGGLFAGTVYLSGDGRLWLWDVFNRDQEGIAPRSVDFRGQQVPTRNGANFIEPARISSPFVLRFALDIGPSSRALDGEGFRELVFDGRYPLAAVDYRDADCPLAARLEAFSPFVPLDVASSSLPATILSYTIRNETDRPQACAVRGWLENPICLFHRGSASGKRVNRIARSAGLTVLACSAIEAAATATPARPDVLYADFESARYEGWTAEGEAFGSGPVAAAEIPDYQGDVGGRGQRVVNSHASAPGGDVREKDERVGGLTSEPFAISRKFINFLIGGGAHAGQTCLELLIDGEVVAEATGRNDNRMLPGHFAVAGWEGQTARLRIADRARGGWGNIGVDQIVFSDRPATAEDGSRLADLHDHGTMALGLLGSGDAVSASAACDANGRCDAAVESAEVDLADRLLGSLEQRWVLAPGESRTATFLVAWHFPNFSARGLGKRRVGHSYASRFASASEVAGYVAEHFERLSGDTRRWVETWYDATLPYWLLDRTMANTSTLATTTCYRFADGRFWAWEGIGCCEGTCTHVWHYAQAPGRLFPEIERQQRQQVDFGIAQHGDGGIGMRAGLDRANEPAHDGQCGRILGAYREHQMSRDNGFLRGLWPRIKLAIEYMIRQDGDADGMVEGAQPNTLDAAWYGRVSFLASLYLAALRAGEAMAREVGDEVFAERCRGVADRGAETILGLYNGEYFTQVEDPAHADAIGVGPGCYIDQVFGQTWAHWVGLGALFDRERQLSALRALWTYNFVPDVGPFRQRFERGRWYALAGDAGLLMCTWPRGGQNPNFLKHWQYQYFNECMSGFEWQAAAHMIWEGQDQADLLEHGLAVARAIHDRYHPKLRNPYNEIECSDHYARAMASYGVYQAVCGCECHGPRGHLGFAPRLTPDDFRAAFTAAGGWGTFRQQRTAGEHRAEIEIRWGAVRLRTVALALREGFAPRSATARVGDRSLAASVDCDGHRALVTLADDADVKAGQALSIVLS